jgi:GT2 family glycosyltransferase
MMFILLPVHDRRQVTENFARALSRQSVQDFHLLLIDDGSTDGTADSVVAMLPGKVTVLRGTGDWWWGGALHQGWRWLLSRNIADDGVVCICNDDVDLPDEFLENGVLLLDQNPRSLVVAKARDPQSGIISDSCFAIDYRSCSIVTAKPGDTNICAPTRGLFVRWADMRRVGGFHPRLLPHYLSDLEWTFRAARSGLAIHRDDRLWLIPHHDKTGPRSLSNVPPLRRVGQLFSTKFVGNPLYWSSFILLSFPPRYWLPALSRVALWSAGALLGR